MIRRKFILLLVLSMSCAPAAWSQAQGPLTPAPKKETKRIAIDKPPDAPPIPVEEIIRRFSEKETELFRLRSTGLYLITAKLVEFDEKGEQAGEFQMVSQASVAADGKPIERILRQTPSSLKTLDLPPEDLEEITRAPAFMLPAQMLANYDLVYEGTQPVDELNTFVFRITPKRLERRQRFFEGAIWVDDQDFSIVKSYGKYVTDVLEDATRQPFQLFETYRQLVDGKYWMPAYSRAEEILPTKKGEVKLRLTIRYEEYKLKPAGPAAKP